jgi:hypothetical protein
MHDVRDVRGRLARLGISVVLGTAGALAISIQLPSKNARIFSVPTLTLAGAIAISVGIYAVLDHLRRRLRLPSARLLRVRFSSART